MWKLALQRRGNADSVAATIAGFTFPHPVGASSLLYFYIR